MYDRIDVTTVFLTFLKNDRNARASSDTGTLARSSPATRRLHRIVSRTECRGRLRPASLVDGLRDRGTQCACVRAIFVSLSRPLRHPRPPTFLRPLRPLPVCSCVPPQQPCTRCFTDSQWTRYTLDLVRSIHDYAPKISRRTNTTENFRFSSLSFASFSFAHYCCRFNFSSTTWKHHLHLATSYTINAAMGFTLRRYPQCRLLVIYLYGLGYASVRPYRRELKTDESSLRILERTGRCVDSRNRNSIQPYRVGIHVYIYTYRRTRFPLSGLM